MADLAVIGFSADTSGLEKGTRELDRINKAAIALTTSEKQLAKATEAASASRANAALKAAKAEDSLAAASLRKLKASGSASKAEMEAAMALRRSTLAKVEAAQKSAGLVQKLNSESEAMRRNAAAAQEQYNALLGVNRARKSARMSASVFSNAPEANVPRDLMPNRFNTANIAAQFQDVGVTAAMGMNPLIIAMQQGTQMSAIFNSMEKPLAGLKMAFMQIINPVSLVTIGLVGLVAAGLQMVDWSSTAETMLNLLGDAVEYLGPLLVGLAAALLILNWNALVAGVVSGVTSLGALAVAAIAAGKAFVAMGIAWLATPIGMITAAVAALAAGIAYASGAFDDAGAAVRGWAADLRSAEEDADNLMKTIDQQTIDLHNQITALRLHGRERIAFIREQELINELASKYKGKELIEQLDNQEKHIKDAAAAYADARVQIEAMEKAERDAERNRSVRGAASGSKKDPWAELNQSARQRIENLKMEQAALGMSERAAAKMRYEQEMLNEAVQKGIDLSPRQRAEIAAMAGEMATIEDQTRSTKEAMDFLRDGTKGFFQDLKQGLQEGKSLWESFGNAVVNVLNKIMDRMLTSGAEAIFDGLFSKAGGGTSSVVGDLASFLFSANGNAFGTSGRIEPFAKGGAFTNTIVDRATPFMFANGGKFGVMGEKGAEAVMPLHRGSDGSLGVKVSGGSGGSTAVVLNINNFGNSTVSTQQRQTANGVELDVMIDEMVAQKIADQSSSTNRSLNTRDSRRIISR